MTTRPLTYRAQQATWSLEFTQAALSTLSANVQRGAWSRESVGQLYTRDFAPTCVKVELVTKLVPKWSAFARVQFDVDDAMRERERLFDEGLFCIGLWHSHPQRRPVPSSEDLELAANHGKAARHQLNGLVFAIVGTSPFPEGLGVWLHDGHQPVQLLPDGEHHERAVLEPERTLQSCGGNADGLAARRR